MFVALALVTLLGQDPPKPPAIFSLKREERLAGNPLAEYAAMIDRQAEFMADPQQAGIYPELRANLEQSLGDPSAVGRGLAIMYGNSDAGPDLTSSPLDKFMPKRAVDAIVRAVGNRPAVMVGEEHHSPQSRSLVIPLLRALRKKGFRYYAAETFLEDTARIQRQGYPDYRTGVYTTEPVFAESVREAVRLGYILVPYEARNYDPKLDPGANQENRERGQAENLKARIFDKDPKAKVLVHGGRGHVSEGGAQIGETKFRFMGAHFKSLTGIDPLSVYCTSMIEHEGKPRHESPIYRYATARGWVKSPTVFVDAKGKPWSESPDLDVSVFFPRVRLVQGRPDWMARDLERRIYRLPAALTRGQGLRLVQARPMGEPATSVPTDQVLLRPGEIAPALMLPRGRFRVRTIDRAGTESSVLNVRI